MNRSILVVLVSLSISIIAFGVHAADEAHGHGSSEHGSEAAAGGLKLNNGDRWEMDDHTRNMSSKMDETFTAADHSNQASLNALGVQMESQLDELVKGCTMEGEAHAQLHVFLSQYMPDVQNLSKAEDYETARNLAIKIKGDLAKYKKHFK